MSNLLYRYQRNFQFSSCFEPIDVVTLLTLWWPQLHSTQHQPQVSFICFKVCLYYDKYRFHVSLGHLISKEKKSGSLNQLAYCKNAAFLSFM